MAIRHGLPRIRDLVEQVRILISRPRILPQPVGKRRRVTQVGLAPDTRASIIASLKEAIAEAEREAKASSSRTKKGSGGIPPKMRWYQLIGTLITALDGVLKNFDIEGVKEQIQKMRVEMDELQRTTPQTTG